MQLEHWLHVFAGGGWREPVAEHLWMLDYYGYDGPFHVGIIGPKQSRAEVLDELQWIRQPTRVVERAEGWEQPTLWALHQHAQLKRDAPDVILYTHTKGAYQPTVINRLWRQSMTALLLDDWRGHVERITAGEVDVIGSHWLTAEEYNPAQHPDTPFPCFGGNFWMASTRHLRTLPKCWNRNRYDAEGWVGLNNPRVTDLKPGWPGDFYPIKCGRIIAGR